MLPILFKFGPITVYSFGFFLTLAFLVSSFLFWKEGKRQGYNEEKLLDLSVLSLVAAIVGGRIQFVLANWNNFKDDILEVFYFWHGGFAYYGAFLAVILIGIFYTRRWKWPFFQVADVATLSVSLGIFFGKIGTFLASLDFGKVSNVPWAVQFPDLVGKRHPVQLYEAFGFLVIFVVLYFLYFRNLASQNMKSGKVFFTFLISTSLLRFVTEYFRAQSFYIGPIPLISVLSFVIATVSIIALYYFQVRSFKDDLEALTKIFFSNLKAFRRIRY